MNPDFTVRNTSRVYVARAEELLPQRLCGEQVFVVTDEVVEALYPDLLPHYPHICIPCGEQHKTLTTVESIHRRLLAQGADRKSFLLAVGGGIVTDTAGFAASTYMRGIRFGFLSTTLLGQVDASVGGKNGVNVDGYKNMAGTFTQPEFVVCDTTMLRTLPEREFRAGLAEVVKSAIIADPNLFERLEQTSFTQLRSDEALLEQVVRAAVGVKVAIVERDEREAGERRLLNLGHTLAHAIEKCSHAMNHGEAVAVGMRLVADSAVRGAWLSAAERNRICGLLTRLGFVLESPVGLDRLLAEVGKDKKSDGESIHLIVPHAIGHCEVHTLEKEALQTLFKQDK